MQHELINTTWTQFRLSGASSQKRFQAITFLTVLWTMEFPRHCLCKFSFSTWYEVSCVRSCWKQDCTWQDNMNFWKWDFIYNTAIANHWNPMALHHLSLPAHTESDLPPSRGWLLMVNLLKGECGSSTVGGVGQRGGFLPCRQILLE